MMFLGNEIKKLYAGSDIAEAYLGNGKIYPSTKDPVLYKTNFSNFDNETFIDIPIVGEPLQFTKVRNTVSGTTKVIDGIEYSGLYIDQGQIDIPLSFIEKLPDVYTVEYTFYKDSFAGLGCGAWIGNVICPFYNCYASDRGMGCQTNGGRAEEIYNGAVKKYDYGYFGDWYSRDKPNIIRTAGVTIDRTTKMNKCYISGKKIARKQYTTEQIFMYGDSGWKGSNWFVIEMNIYNTDVFDEME